MFLSMSLGKESLRLFYLWGPVITNLVLCRAREKFTCFFLKDLVMSLEGSSFWYFTSEQNPCKINQSFCEDQ